MNAWSRITSALFGRSCLAIASWTAVVFGCDFAAGGDDNVIVKRVGNKVAETITWKDKNTANAAGRFVRELRRGDLRLI
jgi:hypothetical protein